MVADLPLMLQFGFTICGPYFWRFADLRFVDPIICADVFWLLGYGSFETELHGKSVGFWIRNICVFPCKIADLRFADWDTKKICDLRILKKFADLRLAGLAYLRNLRISDLKNVRAHLRKCNTYSFCMKQKSMQQHPLPASSYQRREFQRNWA
jgi:hypothetical protein